jgi:hypothetical protein
LATQVGDVLVPYTQPELFTSKLSVKGKVETARPFSIRPTKTKQPKINLNIGLI